jgi:hypothetical protein
MYEKNDGQSLHQIPIYLSHAMTSNIQIRLSLHCSGSGYSNVRAHVGAGYTVDFFDNGDIMVGGLADQGSLTTTNAAKYYLYKRLRYNGAQWIEVGPRIPQSPQLPSTLCLRCNSIYGSQLIVTPRQ